jgi:hypothetical protein
MYMYSMAKLVVSTTAKTHTNSNSITEEKERVGTTVLFFFILVKIMTMKKWYIYQYNV